MKGTKFAIFLAFLLSAVSLAGNGFFYQKMEAEHAQLGELQSREAELQDQNIQLENQANELKTQSEELRGQIEDYTDQRDAARKELDAARKEAGDLKKRIKELESEKSELSNRMNMGEVTEKAIVREAAKLPEVPTAPPTFSNIVPVVGTQPIKPIREEKAPTPEPKPAPKISPQKESVPKPAVDQRPSQVLSVNRQFNFVVVNVGLRDKVKIGDTLRVEESGKLVGRVQVEKLYENFSACTILEEMKPAQIKEGDLVRIA